MRRLLDYRSKKKSTTKTPAEPSATSASAEPAATVVYGLQVVCEGINPIVDIVAVHGLNGHCEKTWTAGNGVNWLRDLLPQDLPNARILSWGYDANTHSSSRVSTQYLYDHGCYIQHQGLRTRQTSKRPIIFVAHSLGGIVVKSALIHSDAARRGALEEHRSIKLSTYGIMFMGTPHQGGSSVALGRLIVNVASMFVAADDRLLRLLERDSEALQQQLGQYGPISRDFVTKYAYEEYATPTLLGQSILVVPRASAVVPGAADSEPIAIHADHTNIVKFESRSNPGYKTVSGHLQVMAARAGDTVRRRWDAEGRVDAARSNEPIRSFTVQSSVPQVSRVEHFIGRDEELDRIHQELKHDDTRKIVVVHGLGGIGKTQLALAYAQRHKDAYSAVFWVNSKDVDTLRQGYAAAAMRIYREHPSLVHLQTAAGGNYLDEAVEAVKQWLGYPQNNRWLVIYDNYDTPKLPGRDDAGTYDIRAFLPEADHGAVLITTRSSQLSLGSSIALKKLQNIEHSIEILFHASKRCELSSDPRAYELAQELDGLPLALATAGAYLSQVSTSFANYLQLYNASWLRLQQKTPQLLSYEDRALYSTWGISLEYVKQQSTSAFKLLQLWAYFDRQDVWFELLHKCQGNGQDWFSELTEDQLSFDEAVRVLCDHALVEVDITLRDGSAESRGYSMHSCVHSWTKNVVNKEWDNELASLAICCVSSQVLERSSPQYWVTDRRLVGHGDRCLAFIRNMRMEKDDNLLIPEAARNLAVYYSRQGRLREAEELYELGLKRSKDAAKPRKFEIEILNNLGNLFLQSDRLEEADEMFRQALDISERTFSPEHRLSLRTVNHLGVCLLQKGQLDEAGVMLERALEGRRDVCRPDHLSTSETALNLGQLYSRQGDNDKAQKMLLMALRGREGVLGANHPLTLETVSNLGNLHYMQGKPAETKKRFCQALEGFEQAYGPDHTSTLQLACNLGQLYMEYHELVQAEKMFSRAWRGYEQAFGTNLTLRLGMINDLGFLYVIQGKVDEAEEMYLQALAGREKALGPDHTSTLDTVKNLGSLYVDQGKLDEAEEMYRRALAGYEKRLSSEHARCRDLCETLAFLESDIAS